MLIFTYIKAIANLLILGRVPVPNGGECDWGLPNADKCSYCKNYFDPRQDYGNTDDGKCVWVPGEGKCYPKKWASDNQMSYDEDCTGNHVVLLNMIMLY